jgi:pre-mRNA branch site protein p14
MRAPFLQLTVCLVLRSFLFPPFFVQSRLPPEVNRILYVRNLPFTMTADELYAIFGRYGAVYQIRLGDAAKDTRGTAFVVYEDIYDAKAAVDHLSGFNVGGRYLIVLYYQPGKFQKRAELEERESELQELRKRVAAQKARSAAAAAATSGATNNK